jgi:hypothetical protein
MLVKINGSPLDVFNKLDKFIDQSMQATPLTHYVHNWTIGMTDEVIVPMAKIGGSVGWGIGTGLWKTLDYAGYVFYEKFPDGLGGVMHEVITETVKNCTAGTGCF